MDLCTEWVQVAAAGYLIYTGYSSSCSSVSTSQHYRHWNKAPEEAPGLGHVQYFSDDHAGGSTMTR